MVTVDYDGVSTKIDDNLNGGAWYIGHTSSQCWVIHILVFLVLIVFSKELLTSPMSPCKNTEVWVWARSLNFLYDSTLFVIDIHWTMPISLILIPFGHFHFRQTLAVKCIPDLRFRHICYSANWLDTSKLGAGGHLTKIYNVSFLRNSAFQYPLAEWSNIPFKLR